jgi:hypothetical protein
MLVAIAAMEKAAAVLFGETVATAAAMDSLPIVLVEVVKMVVLVVASVVVAM